MHKADIYFSVAAVQYICLRGKQITKGKTPQLRGLINKL